ncbi:DUF3829 domain-containing protein [Aureibaculum sp. 2210JD6-5]|uniref:DUF3829 domain-containing protein n=1 Tax=Aureibaculum sp. 2210JD6-5 TaxID=3103957 RepID=UPI002AADC546|nr:DUF3829 domain-containing protein [Aureibaculum sp. 2210JD6-5]MDY7396145.1 DUF3829 domain-containing protein [Aureibaculum sp. 2210JD6-5]
MTSKKIFILILVLISFFACNNAPDDNSDSKADNISIKEPTDYDLKVKKIKIITDNFNNFSKEAFKTYQDYISSFGNDPENFKSENISNFSEINDYQVRLLKTLDSAIALPILDELNPLIRSYKINARAFSVTINSCESYYSKKEYKKDGYDKGNVLHKLTIDIYDKFYKADSILRLKSERILQKLDNEYLNSLKKDGFEIKYWILLAKKEAEKLNSVLSTTKYSDLNLEELKRLNGAIAKSYNRLTELKDADSIQFDKKSTAYYSDLEELLNATSELYERKKAKKVFSKKELKKLNENEVVASSVTGSIHAVTFAYKNLLKSFKEVEAKQVYISPKIANTKVEIANSIKMPSAIK